MHLSFVRTTLNDVLSFIYISLIKKNVECEKHLIFQTAKYIVYNSNQKKDSSMMNKNE